MVSVTHIDDMKMLLMHMASLSSKNNTKHSSPMLASLNIGAIVAKLVSSPVVWLEHTPEHTFRVNSCCGEWVV